MNNTTRVLLDRTQAELLDGDQLLEVVYDLLDGNAALREQVTALQYESVQADQRTAEWRTVAHSVANRTDELRSIIDSLRGQLGEAQTLTTQAHLQQTQILGTLVMAGVR